MDSNGSKKASPKSPRFIKPMEVFLCRKKKRISNISPTCLKLFSPLKCVDLNSPKKDKDTTAIKTKSPFKKLSANESEGRKENRIRSYCKEKARKSKSPKKHSTKRQLNFQINEETTVPVITLDEDANLEPPLPKIQKTSNLIFVEDRNKLPVDWSLKTRIRFISKKQFPFKGNFKASEDATGSTAFVRCLFSSPNKSPLKHCKNTPSSLSQAPALDTSLVAKLRQHCFVWIYPNFSWLPLFPRLNVSNSTVKNPIPMDNSSLMESLFNDWCYSVRSLYQLIKVRQNAFFYLCSNAFTVLFRAAGVASIDEITAFVHPTSSGFRKLLKDEEISFSMPLRENNSQASENETENSQKPDETNVIEGDDESMVFLESLGLSQQDFPSLKQNKTKSSENMSASKNSLLMIQGPDTMLFLTFLTSSPQYVVAKTGPFAGIPPTLLSPVAFHGGSLYPLKLKESEIIHKDNPLYSLEISGPVLPNNVHGLCEFMRETQDGNYKASLSTQESTAPFTKVNAALRCSPDNTLSVFATESLKDCGCHIEFLNDICASTSRTNRTISNIVLENFAYSF
ncbi:protein downstream neighbor of Son-like protein, partial [Dinothrombium tinctorium]